MRKISLGRGDEVIDEDLIADASAALHELSRGPNKKRSDPAIKKGRGKIRFAIYKKLSSLQASE